MRGTPGGFSRRRLNRRLPVHTQVAFILQLAIVSCRKKWSSFGGRDRDRTGDPLLAKQVGKNTKCFVWCRLHGNPAKFPLLNCTEVVPKSLG